MFLEVRNHVFLDVLDDVDEQHVFLLFVLLLELDALQLPYSNAKLEATNNLIKRNAFGFRNFEKFKKRIFIALNIKKERTKFVLSQS